MELLLNLLWLVLAVPAIFLWHREGVSRPKLSSAYRSRSFILLGCLLALLFPVVSATDDLHAMYQEAEESGPSKRIVKAPLGIKSNAVSHDGTSPATLIRVDWPAPEFRGRAPILLVSTSVPSCARPATGCRAPPFSYAS